MVGIQFDQCGPDFEPHSGKYPGLYGAGAEHAYGYVRLELRDPNGQRSVGTTVYDAPLRAPIPQ
jgi:hypothetical protein